MVQLQINQGPQDALLYDNTRSYFTNVGYVRTSNFQVEYRDTDSQNTANFGTTVQYVIPKAADLLGPVDLIVDLDAPADKEFMDTLSTGSGEGMGFLQWVDELGFAMIEKCTFSVGSNDIETLTGEQMQLRNELMTSDEQRLGYAHVLKTGRRATQNADGASAPVVTAGELPVSAGAGVLQSNAVTKTVAQDFTRLIAFTNGAASSTPTSDEKKGVRAAGRKLIIPLPFFFCKHVSTYFPLVSIAGCNDVRISLKFRDVKSLVQVYGQHDTKETIMKNDAFKELEVDKMFQKSTLRCHYVHVTGPEAQILMNKEHVRLMKMWQHISVPVKLAPNSDKIAGIDLSFLHPVTTLLITIRKAENIDNTTVTPDTKVGGSGYTATYNVPQSKKGYFFYHGDGTDPNYDAHQNGGVQEQTIKVDKIGLKLNGQERHPGLSDGLEVDFINHRLLPMLHSNSNQVEKQLLGQNDGRTGATHTELLTRYSMQGSKNIFIYPFSLNPEGSNPSGAVNFSKVSHAKLDIKLKPTGSSSNTDDYIVDVHGLYYNWLQIKDGRALLSFA